MSPVPASPLEMPPLFADKNEQLIESFFAAAFRFRMSFSSNPST